MEALGPVVNLGGRRRAWSQDTCNKSSSHGLSPRSNDSSGFSPRNGLETSWGQQSSASRSTMWTGSQRAAASCSSTAGSQFKLPSFGVRPPRSPMVDLAFSLSPMPRRGGAAVWKLEEEGPPDAPWELHKDEAMWVALTGIRKMERQRHLQSLPARTAAVAALKVFAPAQPVEETQAGTATVKAKPVCDLELGSPRHQAQLAQPVQFQPRTPETPHSRSSHRSKESKSPVSDGWRRTKAVAFAATAIQRIVRGMQTRQRRSCEEAAIALRLQETAKRMSSLCTLQTHWRPGAELPVTDTGGLWELMEGGHITRQISVVDFLAILAECKKSGLNVTLSNAVLGNFSGIKSPRDPVEVHTRQVAAVIAELIRNPGMDLNKDVLQGIAELVPDPFGEVFFGYEDLGIANTTCMDLVLFRKTFQCIALLMMIDECYIVCHIVWHMTGEFEVSSQIGLHVYRQMGLRAPSPLRVSNTDFLNLCVAFRVQTRSGRNILQGDSVAAIFTRALQNIPRIFERRRFRKMHVREEVENFDKHEKRKYAAGWTEWSILLQELFAAIPRGTIPNPLQMCLAGPQFTFTMPVS